MKTAISLFSCAGIGDLAFRRSGINVVLASELLKDRCDIFKLNYPQTKMIEGSIWDKEKEIVKSTKVLLKNKSLDFALVTPPCQGMSKNGKGKLLSEIRAGRRPEVDERNLLIIPALNILKEVSPEVIIFENVSEMLNTIIPYENQPIGIIELIKKKLKGYSVEEKVINFADYGIPQNRKRLITLATKKKSHKIHLKKMKTLFPEQTHFSESDLLSKRWRTLRDAIGLEEELDGSTKLRSDENPLHFVSKLDERKYHWISLTPEGRSAFDNQCIECNFSNNQKHSSKKNIQGINKASEETPIYCIECGSVLPRPHVEEGSKKRIMKGFTSAYKRMSWDEPASAITTNFPYVSSDNKVHPSQNRTLSVYEAMIIQTIQPDEFKFWSKSPKDIKFTTIRESIGESVPPKMIELILKKLSSI